MYMASPWQARKKEHSLLGGSAGLMAVGAGVNFARVVAGSGIYSVTG